MVKLSMKMNKKEIIKTVAAVVVVLAFAAFFYRLFTPSDIPGLLTYAIFFVLIPSFAAYYVIDKLIDRFLKEKERIEVIE